MAEALRADGTQRAERLRVEVPAEAQQVAVPVVTLAAAREATRPVEVRVEVLRAAPVAARRRAEPVAARLRAEPVAARLRAEPVAARLRAEALVARAVAEQEEAAVAPLEVRLAVAGRAVAAQVPVVVVQVPVVVQAPVVVVQVPAVVAQVPVVAQVRVAGVRLVVQPAASDHPPSSSSPRHHGLSRSPAARRPSRSRPATRSIVSLPSP